MSRTNLCVAHSMRGKEPMNLTLRAQFSARHRGVGMLAGVAWACCERLNAHMKQLNCRMLPTRSGTTQTISVRDLSFSSSCSTCATL